MRTYEYVTVSEKRTFAEAVSITCDICEEPIRKISGMYATSPPGSNGNYGGGSLDATITKGSTHSGDIRYVCAEWCDDCTEEVLDAVMDLAKAKRGGAGYHEELGRAPWHTWLDNVKRKEAGE